MAPPELLLMLFLILPHSYHQAYSLSILKDETVPEGSSVSATCGADAVDLVNNDKIHKAALYRKTSTDDKLVLMVEFNFLRRAISSIKNPLLTADDLGWDYGVPGPITLSDPVKVMHRDYAIVNASTGHVRFQDSGMYLCKVTYSGWADETEKNQSLLVTERVEVDEGTTTPAVSKSNASTGNHTSMSRFSFKIVTSQATSLSPQWIISTLCLGTLILTYAMVDIIG